MKKSLSWRSMSLGFSVAFVLMLISSTLSRGFPPVNVDEAYLSNHAANLMAGETNRYSLYDDMFEEEYDMWRDATAGLLQIGYQSWLGPFVHWFPKSLTTIRLSSVIAGFIALCLWFFLGTWMGGTKTGYACLLLGWLNPFFQLASQQIRAEMILVMAASVTITFLFVIPERFPWKYGILGFLSGLQIGIHQNCVPVFLGFLVLALLRSPAPSRLKRALYLCLSFGAGFIFIFGIIDLPKFWMSQQIIVYDLYKPPLLTWPWNPFGWIFRWGRLMLTGVPSWYLPQNSFLSWKLSIGLYWLVALAILLLVRFRVKANKTVLSSLKPLGFATLAVFVGLCLFIGKNESIYVVIFLPFFVLLVGSLMALLMERKKKIALALSSVLLLGFTSYCYFIQEYRQRYPSYDSVVSQVRAVIPLDARVAGPAIFWFSWPEENFRDISGLVGSRWITGGKRDVKRWLSRWKPDVIILEESWKRMLLGKGEALARLQQHFGSRVTKKGEIETGVLIFGTLEIFQLDWKTTAD